MTWRPNNVVISTSSPCNETMSTNLSGIGLYRIATSLQCTCYGPVTRRSRLEHDPPCAQQDINVFVKRIAPKLSPDSSNAVPITISYATPSQQQVRASLTLRIRCIT